MRQVASAFLALTCLVFCGGSSAQAQVTVGFVNKSGTPVAVSAYSVVNNVKTPTRNLVVPKNGTPAFEIAVPANAVRYYVIHDATQPSRILSQGVIQVPVQMRSLQFRILPSPTDPKKVVIEPYHAQ